MAKYDIDRFEDIKIIPGNGISPFTGYKVFRAWDNELKRHVVVKSGYKPSNMHMTIKEEYNFLSRLDHIGVIKVYGYQKNAMEYMIMADHTLGGRRSRWREIFKTATEEQCRTFIQHMINTLLYLRREGVINGDVEMANIVATYPWHPVMIDFGRVWLQFYTETELVAMLHPGNNTRVNAWVRELCGIGGKYAEEGAMVDFNIKNMIIEELQKI